MPDTSLGLDSKKDYKEKTSRIGRCEEKCESGYPTTDIMRPNGFCVVVL